MDRAEDGKRIKARIVRRYSGHDLLSVLERQIKVEEGNIHNLSIIEQ